MVFELDRGNGVPLYLQIKDRIVGLIEEGTLRPADRLPATRDLSRDLGVNRNTVVKAYEELEVEGKVRSGVGQGTFVAEFARGVPKPRQAEPAARADFEGLWSQSCRIHEGADSNRLLFQVTHLHESGVTALSSSLPDKALFPMREFRNCAYYALHKYGADLLDLGSSQGFVPFLDYLPKYLLRHGLEVRPEDLIVTSGIQQGIDLVARALINPGDTVITEEFTYPWAITVFRAFGADVAGIPMDHSGMKVEVLERVLARRQPKLIYTIPTFHNPTGTTMTLERRRRLLDLAATHKIPILEDHYANDLRLDGAQLLPLAALDRSGWVIGVGSLSKVLFHGLRLGWIITPLEGLRRRIVAFKQASDLQTSYLVQGIILEFVLRGYLEKYLKRRLAQLRSRRDAVRKALQDYLPEPAWWYEVEGGVCYWLNLPPTLRADEVLIETRKKGVVFAPKHLFAVNPSPNDALRVGFTDLPEDRARAGIRVIGQVVRKLLATLPQPPAIPEGAYARVHV
jgi:DNA-binding transcriptional MocR family regulator